MSRISAIILLALFLLPAGVAPVLAMGGGGHGGGNHGGGHGRGGGGGVPEIDPGLAPSAIAFLTGGLLILRDKFRKK